MAGNIQVDGTEGECGCVRNFHAGDSGRELTAQLGEGDFTPDLTLGIGAGQFNAGRGDGEPVSLGRERRIGGYGDGSSGGAGAFQYGYGLGTGDQVKFHKKYLLFSFIVKGNRENVNGKLVLAWGILYNEIT
jgi:hypothetical protein